MLKYKKRSEKERRTTRKKRERERRAHKPRQNHLLLRLLLFLHHLVETLRRLVCVSLAHSYCRFSFTYIYISIFFSFSFIMCSMKFEARDVERPWGHTELCERKMDVYSINWLFFFWFWWLWVGLLVELTLTIRTNIHTDNFLLCFYFKSNKSTHTIKKEKADE